MPRAVALDQVGAWLEAPTLILLAELEGYWNRLSRMLQSGKVIGPKIHDAGIAALCLLIPDARYKMRDAGKGNRLVQPPFRRWNSRGSILN